MRARAIPAKPLMAMMAAAAVALFGFLFWQANASAGGPAQRLLLVTPKAGEAAALAGSARGFDIASLEEFCESHFLVTYETHAMKTARAGQLTASKPVSLVGTNSGYQDLMGYTMADGGFFTKKAWDAKERQAVLNEAAAFALFGGVNVSRQAQPGAGQPTLDAGQPPEPSDAQAEAPAGAQAEAQADTPADTSADAPADTPADAPADAPADTSSDAPSDAPAASPTPAAEGAQGAGGMPQGFPFGGRFRGSANVGDTVPPVSLGLAGSVEIDGEYWTVVGVMYDGSDEANVYVPSSITGGSPVTLAALLGSGAITASRAKSELKAFGVNESAYDFIPMPAVWSAFAERADVALSAAAAAIGMFFIFQAAMWALGAMRARRDEEEASTLHAPSLSMPRPADLYGMPRTADLYGMPRPAGQYGMPRPGDQENISDMTDITYLSHPTSTRGARRAWGFVGICLAVPALAAAVLYLAQRAIPSFLSWQAIYALADAKPALQFSGFLAPLQAAQSLGFSALWAFLGLVAATLLATIASSPPSPGRR